jgi:hypothetical protein
MFHVDQGSVAVQPAGPAGKRHVFLTVTFQADDNVCRRFELVLSEHSAHRLGEALASGAVGVMRELDLQSDTFE